MSGPIEVRAQSVRLNNREVIVQLTSGDFFRYPISLSQRLREATQTERKVVQIIDDGLGLHWPLIDEDLSVPYMLEDSQSPS